MKKFSFSMQSVENVRIAEKRAREIELRDAQMRLDEEIVVLKKIEQQIERALDIKPVLQSRSIYYLLQRERYLTLLKQQHREQAYKVNRAKVKVEIARKKLQLAVMELKKIEKLRDKELDKWMSDFNLEEKKISDEKAVILSFMKKETVK